MDNFDKVYSKLIKNFNSNVKTQKHIIKESADDGFENGSDATLQKAGFYLATAVYESYISESSPYYVMIEKKGIGDKYMVYVTLFCDDIGDIWYLVDKNGNEKFNSIAEAFATLKVTEPPVEAMLKNRWHEGNNDEKAFRKAYEMFKA